MNKIIKVLIVEHSLPFYHIHSWELLGSHLNIDLTVAYGEGFFTGEKDGVPEGVISDNASFRFKRCKITKTFLGKKYLWHSAAISLVKKNNYDLIIHQAELKMLSLFYIMRLAKKSNTKFALWGIGNPLKSSKILDQVRKYIAVKSDAFIFYSDNNKKKYINWVISPNKLFVAKNSIDINSIFEFKNAYSLKKLKSFKDKNGIDSFSILTVGRLIERKKISWLLEAAALLKRKNYKIKLIIIGNGHEYNKLVAQSKNLGLFENTIFTGKLVGLENLGPWFIASDIVVAPGQIGHLATEAHAFEKPVILSDCKHCKGPEAQILIPNETGLLYSHGNIEDLSIKIETLINSSELRKKLSSKCISRVKDFAGTKIMVNGFLNAISKLTHSDIDYF